MNKWLVKLVYITIKSSNTMKLKVFKIGIVLGILAFFSLNITAQTAAYTDYDVGRFSKMMGQPNVQILDVRTAAEFNSGHLAGAMQADWTRQKEFELRASSLDKSKPILVYCQAGGRSAAASNYLATKGFKVTNMIGGMNAWSQASLPIEGAKNDPKNVVTKAQMKAQINQKGYCLVDYGATWCPPCRKMKPIVADILKKNKIRFLYIDVPNNQALFNESGYDAMPVFKLYKDGKEIWSHQGTFESKELTQHLK